MFAVTANKICSKIVSQTFPLSYENVIVESFNVPPKCLEHLAMTQCCLNVLLMLTQEHF